MSVETAANISQLDATLPTSTDVKSEGDDHMRLIKSAIKATFPSVTGITTSGTSNVATLIPTTSMVQSAIAAATVSPAFTGTPTAPTATPGTKTTQIATTAFVLAQSFSATGAESSANKDASGGYAGLTGYSHNFKNAAGTFTSYLANTNTASRTYTYQDKTGSVAHLDDCLTGFRNRIINGDMRIDQRNAGASQTITAAAALAYTVDRFYAYCTGANVTGQQVAGSGNSQNRYQFTGAASVTAIGFGTRLEAKNTYDINSQTVTIEADLANSLLTTVTWTLYRATTIADTFGTLASPTVTQIATGTFTVNSTVTRYNAQVSVPAAATTGLQLVLSVGAQTSGTWTIGNVQLELGSTATTFEQRPIGTELALCQRYYQTSYPVGVAPGTGSVATPYVIEAYANNTIAGFDFGGVSMRTTATVVIYSTSGTVAKVAAFLSGTDTGTTVSAGNISDKGVLTVSDSGTGFAVGAAYRFHWTASAEL